MRLLELDCEVQRVVAGSGSGLCYLSSAPFWKDTVLLQVTVESVCLLKV